MVLSSRMLISPLETHLLLSIFSMVPLKFLKEGTCGDGVRGGVVEGVRCGGGVVESVRCGGGEIEGMVEMVKRRVKCGGVGWWEVLR